MLQHFGEGYLDTVLCSSCTCHQSRHFWRYVYCSSGRHAVRRSKQHVNIWAAKTNWGHADVVTIQWGTFDHNLPVVTEHSLVNDKIMYRCLDQQEALLLQRNRATRYVSWNIMAVFFTELLTRSSANPEEPCEHTVSWNRVKCCTNVRRIACENACNRWMTSKVIQGHCRCHHLIGHILFRISLPL